MTQTLALFIDALSDQYVTPDNTPNLHRWAQQNGFCRPAPLFAFQGVGMGMFAGAPPSRTGIWTDFKVMREPQGRPTFATRALDRIPHGLPRKALLTIYERLISKAYVTPHTAPANLRPYFVPALRSSITKPNAMRGFPSVFDAYRSAGKTVHVEGLDGGPQQRLLQRLTRIGRRREDLVMIKITFLDHMGHAYGPDSQTIRRAVADIDRRLGDAVASADEQCKVIIFADHGMTPVTGAIDVQGVIKRGLPGLVEGRDYVAFYNSTCVLFRWLNTGAKQAVVELFSNHSDARFMVERDYDELGVGTIAAEYADDVLVTRRGVVVSPDFYGATIWKGMHGFATLEGETATVISPTDRLHEAGFMWDIAPTLAEMGEVSIPDSFCGASLLRS